MRSLAGPVPGGPVSITANYRKPDESVLGNASAFEVSSTLGGGYRFCRTLLNLGPVPTYLYWLTCMKFEMRRNPEYQRGTTWSSRSASQPAFGKTSCESTRETDSAEGDFNEMLNPATPRLATSMAKTKPRSSDGQPPFPIYHHDIHQRVIDLEDVHGEFDPQRRHAYQSISFPTPFSIPPVYRTQVADRASPADAARCGTPRRE